MQKVWDAVFLCINFPLSLILYTLMYVGVLVDRMGSIGGFVSDEAEVIYLAVFNVWRWLVTLGSCN